MGKTVLVTGIGGVVGQGILRNIRQMEAGVRVIGTNIKRVSAGNYLCDRVYEIPFAYDPEFKEAVVSAVKNEDVDLIVPSTDYESYYLGLYKDSFPCPVATSAHEMTAMCLDKWETFKAFAKYNIPFASSCLPSLYQNNFTKTVVKPREGRGSRNINVDPPVPSSFDDGYVVQEYLDGPEITTTFYTTRNKEIHGLITFVRELESGNTAKCEVVDAYDGEMKRLIDQISSYYQFAGSCNIQARVTENGIIPFEINCRISGTNSVRSQFGFKDVAWTVEEYLFGKKPSPYRGTKGSALRVMVDLIYPGKTLGSIENKDDDFYIN